MIKERLIVVDEDIIFLAFRYALGRATYVVLDVVEVLTANWDKLSPHIRALIHKEIEEAIIRERAGWKTVDVPEWEKILKLPI